MNKVNAINDVAAQIIRCAIAAMKEEPRRADMTVWLDEATQAQGGPPCGTVGCIAGWITVVDGEAKRLVAGGKQESIAAFATLGRAQGESSTVFRSLFLVPLWPREFTARLAAAGQGTPEYVQVIAERAEFFIREGW